MCKDHGNEQWCPHLSWKWVRPPLCVWRATRRPQLILDLSPQGLRKEADTAEGAGGEGGEGVCRVMMGGVRLQFLMAP